MQGVAYQMLSQSKLPTIRYGSTAGIVFGASIVAPNHCISRLASVPSFFIAASPVRLVAPAPVGKVRLFLKLSPDLMLIRSGRRACQTALVGTLSARLRLSRFFREGGPRVRA
jgi:hypothetical protein